MHDGADQPGLTQRLPSQFIENEAPAQPGLKFAQPLAQTVGWIKNQWEQIKATSEARALKDAESRALRAEADAARMRNSTGNPFQG